MRIYEVNAALLQTPLEDVDWSFVPDVDAVWLMGVWERSPAGLAIALDDPALMAGMRAALPSSATCPAVVVANRCIIRATMPVHPVWWLAPRPAPLSPWKYS